MSVVLGVDAANWVGLGAAVALMVLLVLVLVFPERF